MRQAFGLVALVLTSQGWAQTSAIRCGETPRWSDFSALVLTVQGTIGDRKLDSMTIDSKVYDDGARLVAIGASRRSEIVWMDGPRGRVVLASEATAPVQLDEVDIVEGVPLEVLMKRFQSPCALQARIRYPVTGGTVEDSIAGEFELEGDAIRFSLLEQRGSDRTSYTGSIRFENPRGKIPLDLAIRGWTIFRGSQQPESGTLSTFNTLREFRSSLETR